MNTSLLMFTQFIKRDLYILHTRVKGLFINSGLIQPFLYSIGFGYVFPVIAGQEANTTVLYVGTIITIAQVIAFSFNLEFFFDLERNRFIEYQITILSPRLVLLERILVSTLVGFFLLLPFFPISYLMLGARLDFSHLSIMKLITHLFLTSWFCTALNIFGLCFVSSSKEIESLWCRLFNPLFMLGGFQVPLATMAAVSPLLGYMGYVNPMIYMSEGIRASIIGSALFLPYSLCFGVGLAFSILFTWLALYYFKNRIDHI